MNSRVAFTLAIALAVLAYLWLSTDPPPVPITEPPRVVPPPSTADELRFEAPQDGGVMTVNYPFMFSSE